jgi:hypothetical protein
MALDKVSEKETFRATDYSDDSDTKCTFKAGKYIYGYSSVVTTDANG